MLGRARKLRQLRRDLESAPDYASWIHVAEQVDALTGGLEWRGRDESRHYHAGLIRQQLGQMRVYRSNEQPDRLIEHLHGSLYRNLGDIAAPELYGVALSGTKYLVEEYLDETIRCFDWLATLPVPADARLAGFERAAHNFGRTALLLSGGATLGFYHLGVVKALFQHDLLPEVISGASMGAMIAAGVCNRTDAELVRLFEDPTELKLDGLRMLSPREAARQRAVLDPTALMAVIEHNCGHATFGETYARSGRHLNISVAPTRKRQKPRVLNHLTAPNVLVSHAALASSAIPGIFPPAKLMARGRDGTKVSYLPTERWIDGSMGSDLPLLRLSRLHNVNHFIVSQTNPHMLPLLTLQRARGLLPRTANLAVKTGVRQGRLVMGLVRQLTEPTPFRALGAMGYGLATQQYGGDIDIHPPFDPRMYRKLMANPDYDDLATFIRDGERAAWPHLAMVRDQTRITTALQRILRQLRAEASSGSEAKDHSR